MSFEGEQTTAGNLLTWKSRHQTYMDFFTIEVSKDGVNWSLVDIIKAEGAPAEIIEYEMFDENLQDELCYYKLLQTDIDGTTVFVGTVQIISQNYINIYPNPTTNLLNIQYTSNLPNRLLIYNLTGSLIFSSNEESSQTIYQKQIDISHLPNNMYLLVLESNDFTASEKFVVQR